MIATSAYRKLFHEVNGVIGYVPMYGNVGDTLIEFATLGLLRQWRIPYEVVTKGRLANGKLPRHIIRLYISGGGNMGSLYPKNREIRRLACKQNRPVTVLPQTFTDSDENTDRFDQVWVRERGSLKLCPGARLAPDMAMYLQLESRAVEARRSIGVFLREDDEGLFAGHAASYGDPVSLGSNIASYLELIVPYRHIVTDRLHFAIAAMLMSRQVTLLPNSYFKNRSMWETWLRKRGCQWADHIDHVDGIKGRRVNKRIPSAESLQLTGKCQIRRAAGWRREHELLIRADGRKKKISRHGRGIWHALDRPRTRLDLAAVLGDQPGANRFKLGRNLNKNLRKLFSMGVIEITTDGSEIHEPLGGDQGIPIEITVSDKLRIGQEVYLFADVRRKGKTVPIWFRIDYRHAGWVGGAADTFLLSFLHVAMKFGSPLWIRGARVTPGLLANLQQYQRVWSLWHKRVSEITIHANTCEPDTRGACRPSRAIACFSGGVDSTFTLFNHTLNSGNRYKLPLTDALLVHGFDVPIEDQASFAGVQQKCQRVASDLGINLITMATNVRHLRMDWGKAHGAVSAGGLHLISAPFTHGLIPSTLNYGILYPWGSTPLTDPMLGSTDFRLVSDGADYTRIDKIRAIKDWETGLKNLRFCSIAYPADHNCGKCGKCTITAIMIRLAKVCRDSIKPFPGHRRLALQLQLTKISRLDKSDFRDETGNLQKLNPSPNWAQLLIRKLDRV